MGSGGGGRHDVRKGMEPADDDAFGSGLDVWRSIKPWSGDGAGPSLKKGGSLPNSWMNTRGGDTMVFMMETGSGDCAGSENVAHVRADSGWSRVNRGELSNEIWGSEMSTCERFDSEEELFP